MPIESVSSSNQETPPDFLAEKWNLHKEPAVDDSVSKMRREGEKVPTTKEDRIEALFSRLDRMLDRYPNTFPSRSRDHLIKEFVINLQLRDGSEDTTKIDRLVQGLFESEKEILRQQGYGTDLERYGDRPRPEDYNRYKETVFEKQAEQVRSIDAWFDYFREDIANTEGKIYPTWFKYTALRSLGKMGGRDRDAGSYSKRSATTLDPFPELSREALPETLELFRQHETGVLEENFREQLAVPSGPLEEADQKLLADLNTYADRGDFARIYAHFQNKIEQIRRERELSEGIAGEWRLFPQDSNPKELMAALAGKGTDWCIARADFATNYLQ